MLLAETMKHGPKTMPRQYLQALLDSPASSKSERLRAAELLLKLVPEPSPRSDSDAKGIEVIYSIPRGAQFAADRKTLIWPDRHICQAATARAIQSNAGLDRSKRLILSRSRERFEVREAEVPQNLVRLDVYKSKRDDSDGEPPGAA